MRRQEKLHRKLVVWAHYESLVYKWLVPPDVRLLFFLYFSLIMSFSDILKVCFVISSFIDRCNEFIIFHHMPRTGQNLKIYNSFCQVSLRL